MERRQTDESDSNDSEGSTLEEISKLDDGIRDSKNRKVTYKVMMNKYTNPPLETIITKK